MPELSTLLATDYYSRKILIHDCVDTGNDQALSAGVAIAFPCDCATRDYKSVSTKALWDSTNSLVKDTIDNSDIGVKINCTVNGAKGAIVKVSCYVPHPTLGDIPVDDVEQEVLHNNLDIKLPPFIFELYNGSDAEAKDYGFKFEIECDQAATLKARSILVKVR